MNKIGLFTLAGSLLLSCSTPPNTTNSPDTLKFRPKDVGEAVDIIVRELEKGPAFKEFFVGQHYEMAQSATYSRTFYSNQINSNVIVNYRKMGDMPLDANVRYLEVNFPHEGPDFEIKATAQRHTYNAANAKTSDMVSEREGNIRDGIPDKISFCIDDSCIERSSQQIKSDNALLAIYREILIDAATDLRKATKQ